MHTKIIAEAAQGYEGSWEYCELYVRGAAKAGADAVKFQCVFADDTAEPGYQYYDFYKKLEMDVSVWQRIKDLTQELGVMLFTDISGDRAMAIAEAIRPDGIKFHSSNFFNRRLIRRAFDIADRVFISIGGIRHTEIQTMLEEVRGWNAGGQLSILYGYQAEPTPIDKSNLMRLPLLKAAFPGLEIGYMDHAPGASEDQIHLSLCALSLGADWIEKHLTLSRYLEVPNYVSALEPDEFARYVETIRRLEPAFGPESMELSEEELVYRDRHVKKLLAERDLAEGHELTDDDLVFKRTPRVPEWQGFHDPTSVVGRRLSRSLRAGEPILEDGLK